MKLPPMEVILSWPKANYINPITRSNGFMVGNFLSLALLTIFMGMYIYSRKFVQKKWTFDNSLCLKAYLCTVALHTTFALGFMNYGWNKHTWDVGIRGAKMALLMVWLTQFFFVCAAGMTTYTLTWYYWRLSSHMKDVRWWIYSLAIGSILVILITVPYFFIVIFQCSDPKMFWRFPQPKGVTCMSDSAVTQAGGIIKLFFNVMFTLLGIPLVQHIAQPGRQKIAGWFLIFIGFMLIILGAVRSYFLWYTYNGGYDRTWEISPGILGMTIENDIGIIIICVCRLGPMFPGLFPNKKEEAQRNFSTSTRTVHGSVSTMDREKGRLSVYENTAGGGVDHRRHTGEPAELPTTEGRFSTATETETIARPESAVTAERAV